METYIRKETYDVNRTFKIEFPGISSPSNSTTHRNVNKFGKIGLLLNKKRQKIRNCFQNKP
jgi:hypothetical protein